MTISFELILQYLVSPVFVRGAAMTLLLTWCALLGGLLIGLFLALLQDARSTPVRGVALAYVWLFRGTPVLFQIIFIFNVLPAVGIVFSGFTSAVLALSLNEGAYMAEILRSGLRAVRPGQRSAGLALGMKNWQLMRYVVVPQALRVVLPALGNQAIGMLKLSALVSVIAVEELLLVANQTASADFHYIEALSAAGIYYLGFTTLLMLMQARIERYLSTEHSKSVKKVSLTQRLLGATSTATAIR
jgi:polar amino acid transport system permease protein